MTPSEQKSLELALDIADALIAKAYLHNPKGDRALLSRAPIVALSVFTTSKG